MVISPWSCATCFPEINPLVSISLVVWLKQGHKLTTEMTGNGQRLSHLLLDVGPKSGDPKRAQLGPLHSTRKKSRAFTAKRQGMKGIL